MLFHIKNFLQSKRAFWQTKRFWDKGVSFNFFKQLYRLRFHIREKKTSASILRRSLPSLLSSCLYATIFVAFFEYIYRVFPVEIPIAISKQHSVLLISTIVTVCGIFLGLYFTIVSAVAGNLFMRATEDLQKLFLREKRGQQYIKTVTLTTVIGICYLLLNALDYSFSPFAPIVIALLAAYAVIRFMSLGSRAFYFLHPVEASVTIASDAAYAIRNATARGFGWKKPFLQNHYRKQAGSSLKTLRNLIDFGISAIDLSHEQLVDIARYSAGVLDYYLTRKKQIPTESLWYKTKPQYKNWLFADANEIGISLTTGTPLFPKNIKDENWFEEECIDVILELFYNFSEKKDWESAHICLELLVSIVEKLGSEFYDETAKLIIKRVGSAVHDSIMTNSKLTDSNVRKEHIAIIDAYAGLAIGTLVGLLKHLYNQTVQKLTAEIRLVDWSSTTGIYRSKLPGKLLANLELTAKKYRAEKMIEGQQISPEWYLISITAQKYLFELQRYFDYAKSLHEDLFKRNVNILIKNEQYLYAANLVQWWLEFTRKLGVGNASFESLVAGCSSLRRAKDLPWIEINFDDERRLIESWDKEAVDKLIQLLPRLTELPQYSVGELPDYFGQAYTFGVEACYQACLENDTDRFKNNFPIVFFGSLAAYDATRTQVQDWATDSRIIFSSEPLEDLLSLSGYSKLYAELYQNNDLWQVCKKTWDNYLDDTKVKDTIGLIVATSNYRDSQFKLMPKGILRTNWKNKFRSILREKNLISDSGGGFMATRSAVIDHPSPLIRMVAKHGDLFSEDPRDIFFATYLSLHNAAQGIKFSDRYSLKDQIERESNSKQNHQQKNGDNIE